MENQPGDRPNDPQAPPRPRFTSSTLGFAFVVLLLFLLLYFTTEGRRKAEISYGLFRQQLDAGNVEQVEFISRYELRGKLKQIPEELKGKTKSDAELEFFVVLSPLVGEELDRELLAKLPPTEGQAPLYMAEEPTSESQVFLVSLFLFVMLIFIVFWFMFRRARDQFLGGRHAQRLQQEPGQAVRRRRASRSPSTTSPAWRTSRTSCRRSSSSSRARRSFSGSAAAFPRACC